MELTFADGHFDWFSAIVFAQYYNKEGRKKACEEIASVL